MKKFLNFILDGYVRLLFPLLICIILIEKLLHLLNPVIHQIKEKLHITRFVGVLDVFLISVVLIILIGLLAGLLIKSTFVTSKIKSIEAGLLRKIPLYNELKSMIGREHNDSDSNNYLPALFKDNESYLLGYITGQSENFYSIVICGSNLQGEELRIVPKGSVRLLNISFFEFTKSIRTHGADAARFAESI